MITQSVTGGGFGGKEEYPSMLAAHVALLAKKAQHAVKIVYDRDEDIAATTKRHPACTHHRLAVDARGEIVAIDVDVRDGRRRVPDAVAGRAVARRASRGGAVSLPGRARARPRASRRTIRRTARSAGSARRRRRSRTSARCRSSRSRAARIRWRCASGSRCARGDTTATGQVLGFSVGTDEVIAAIERVAGPAPVRDGTGANGAPMRRGRGVIFYFHGAGFTGSGESRLAGRATVARTADGRYEVRSSSTDIGQGAITIFTQIAAGGARRRRRRMVDVVDPTTAHVPDSGPTVASRTCMVVGGLVEQRVARAAREARAERPARRRGRGDACSTSRRPASTSTTRRTPAPRIPCYGWAACLVDVSVDLDTYEVTIDRCVQAIDVGKAINPVIVKGQIEGGTLQALGWALLENVVYKDGKVDEREHDELHRADVRRCARARDDPRRGAVSVRAERREGRRRDSDGRPGGGGRERRRGRARLRVRRAADLARGRSPRARRAGGCREDHARSQRRRARRSRSRRGSACSTCCARTSA